MYIYIEGNLTDYYSRDIAIGLTSKNNNLGVGDLTQFSVGHIMHSFIKVTNSEAPFLVSLNVPIISKEEAQAKLNEKFVSTYSVTNEALMGANINQLVSLGTLNLNNFDGVWDSQEEYRVLYEDYNVSGIKKTTIPNLPL